MHACSFHIYDHALFYLFYLLFIIKVGHDHVRATLFKQRPIFCHAYVINSAISCFMF
jgi:hypothetical protein